LRILPLIRAALLALLLAAPVAAAPPSRALTAGAVAAPDRYGALAAQEILKAGGNAVDAAVATAFALAVTYPEAGNIGGGGFMTLYVDGKPYFLDYRETAPAKASATMYLDAKGDVVPDLSLVGPLAAGARSRAQDSLPNRLWASSIPRTVPGTPAARATSSRRKPSASTIPTARTLRARPISSAISGR
jgi:hypothetical protein